MGSTQVDEGHRFEAVAHAFADPFPPGLDPATVRLPSVPKLRSADDDEAHHREYWRAHVWAVLHRYRAAYADPACPASLRADHDRVADEARCLLVRATGTHPISPLDSVACHTALKGLASGVTALERTVAPLRGMAHVPPVDPLAPEEHRSVAVTLPTPEGDGRPEPDRPREPDGADGTDPVDLSPVAGVHGEDFFAPVTPSRGVEFRLSLRGSRGLRRGSQLAGG